MTRLSGHCADDRCVVLVVDDEVSNRLLLREMLEADGARVVEAASGEEALAAVIEDPPDVVLLDIFMPGIDGIEVCRRLKASEETAPIPVLLLTAARGREERLAGIAAGAADFLSKPVDTAELRLRVRSAARSKKLYDEVLANYREVAALERMRDQLVHMIVHDLRSPLTAVRGVLELLEAEAPEGLDDDLMACVASARQGTLSVIGMINTMLDVSRLEAGEMPLDLHEVDLVELVGSALGRIGSGQGRVTVRADGLEQVVGRWDAEVVARIVVNLVSNALKYSPAHEEVVVAVGHEGPRARLTVTDRGPGIPEDQRERIFEKFRQVDGGPRISGASSGLGLAFCRLAAEAHGGEIGVRPNEEGGSVFWLELPTGPRREGAGSDRESVEGPQALTVTARGGEPRGVATQPLRRQA